MYLTLRILLPKEDTVVPFSVHEAPLQNSRSIDSSFLDREASEKPQIPEKNIVFGYNVYGGIHVKCCSIPVKLMVATPEHHALKRPLIAINYTAPQKEKNATAS